MCGKERILAVIGGIEPDCLPFMPITMMFASDHAGVSYRDYATDYRVLAETQLRIAEDYDLDHVSAISDPGREAGDCGATIQYFDDQPPAVDERRAYLSEKTALIGLRTPDPLGGGRMHDRVKAVALLAKRTAGE